MELIVISKSKLKIMLSGADMARYELKEDAVDCADVHTREAFRHIFEDARAEIGFNTDGERLLVQLYTSKGGGCEIFVTKLGGEVFCEEPSTEETVPDTTEKSHVLAVEASCMTEAERELLRRVYACGEEEMVTTQVKTVILRFDLLRDLLTVCRRLFVTGFRGKSQVYIIEGTRDVWFLLLELVDGGLSRLPRKYTFLSEYGEEVRDRAAALYLSEYGRVICGEGAVDILARICM